MGYETDWTLTESADVPCRYCGAKGDIWYREWESSCGGHEDVHYRCDACGEDWWVEGPDA